MTHDPQPFLFADCERSRAWFRAMGVHFSSATDEWATPADVFAALHAEFGFTLDACASAKNAKCERFFTAEDNGLAQEWTGRVWCNPPYGRDITGRWVAKGFASASASAEMVVMLIPSRTDVAWWHDYVMKAQEVRFIRGRLRFGSATSGAPVPERDRRVPRQPVAHPSRATLPPWQTGRPSSKSSLASSAWTKPPRSRPSSTLN